MEVNEGPYWAATMRVARADTGAATGVLNTGGNIGGIVCQPMVAALVAGGDWTSAWVIGAALAALAAVLWLFVRCERTFEPVTGLRDGTPASTSIPACYAPSASSPVPLPLRRRRSVSGSGAEAPPGSSMLAITLSFPPQPVQVSMSMPNTRFRR